MDTSSTPATSISDSLSEAGRLLAWLRQTEEREGTITAIGARLAEILDEQAAGCSPAATAGRCVMRCISRKSSRDSFAIAASRRGIGHQ